MLLIADSIGKDQRGFAFGLHRASDTLGAFLGLGIAALIIWRTQSQSLLLTIPTFKLIVLVSIIPGVLAVIVLALGAVEVTGTSKDAGAELQRLSFREMDAAFQILPVCRHPVHTGKFIRRIHLVARTGTRLEHLAGDGYVADVQRGVHNICGSARCVVR